LGGGPDRVDLIRRASPLVPQRCYVVPQAKWRLTQCPEAHTRFRLSAKSTHLPTSTWGRRRRWSWPGPETGCCIICNNRAAGKVQKDAQDRLWLRPVGQLVAWGPHIAVTTDQASHPGDHHRRSGTSGSGSALHTCQLLALSWRNWLSRVTSAVGFRKRT